MKRLFRNTAGGKAGSLDGMNLFFGALLGANLGTLEGVALSDYVMMILVLAGTVMTIRIISTSNDRRHALRLLALYVALFAAIFLLPGQRPEGMAADDFNRLAATLAIWVGCVLLIEFSPVRDEQPPEADLPQA
jgi:predicted membrane channel-forming protein YqfA (hemolysin III family)